MRSGWLRDCIADRSSGAELYIVSVGKAWTMASELRDREYQAVMGIDRTIVPASEADLWSILDNETAKSLIAALGFGIAWEGNPELSSLDRLRYETIVIAMNDSPDGTYLSAQVIALFHKIFGPVVAAGHVYTLRFDGQDELTEKSFTREVLSPETRILNPLTLQSPS